MLLSYNTLIVLLGTSLLGALSGALGTYLVLRRRALIGDALAHAALPGIGIAFLIFGRSFIGLLAGAFVTALIGSWLVSAIRRHTRIKEDAAIGIVLSVLFGFGIVISRIIQNSTTTGNKAGLDSFIFGKTAGMIAQDIYLIAGVCVVGLILLVAFYKEFKLVSFDSGLASVQGWPILKLDMAMMGLVCVTTIVGLPAVGLALMAAMLIIPGAAARFWTDRLLTMQLLAAGFGLLTGFAGTLASARWASLPTGPIIILAGTFIFIFSMLASPKRGVIARIVRHLKLQQRIADQNLLRSVYELSEPSWPNPPAIRPADLLRLRAWDESEARRLLERARENGWVAEDGGAYRLTEAGWLQAAQVVRAHRLWEIFLIEEAHVAPGLVDRDAEQIEHVLPRTLVDRLESRLRELKLVPAPLGGVPPRHIALDEAERKALQ